MDQHKLIWLNTRDEILEAVTDSIISMQEAGVYKKAYIRSYLDSFIHLRCDLNFIDFSPAEDKYARIDMFNTLYDDFGIDP